MSTARISFNLDDGPALAVLYRQVVADLATVDAANPMPAIGLDELIRKYGQLAMVLDSPRLLAHLTRDRTPTPTADLDDLTAFIDQRARTGQTRLPLRVATFEDDDEATRQRMTDWRAGRVDHPGEDNPLGHEPRRGNVVEAWIKRRRDGHRPGSMTAFDAVDALLDDYRLHADTGTPLHREVKEPHDDGTAGRQSGDDNDEFDGLPLHMLPDEHPGIPDRLLAGYRNDVLTAIASLRGRLGFAAPEVHDELWDELARHVSSILSGDRPRTDTEVMAEEATMNVDGRESITVEMDVIVEPKDGCRWAFLPELGGRCVVYEEHGVNSEDISGQAASDRDIANAVIGAVDRQEDPADWPWRVRAVRPTGAAWITDDAEVEEACR